MRENRNRFNIDCFAHQLKLTLVAIVESHAHIMSRFKMIAAIIDVIRGSKQRDILRSKEIARIAKEFNRGELTNG